MAYTKFSNDPASSAVSAVYIQEGDRVRLVKYAALDAEELDRISRDRGYRVENPEIGATGTVMRFRDFGGGHNYFAVIWDNDRKDGAVLNPIVREETGDIIELVNQ